MFIPPVWKIYLAAGEARKTLNRPSSHDNAIGSSPLKMHKETQRCVSQRIICNTRDPAESHMIGFQPVDVMLLLPNAVSKNSNMTASISSISPPHPTAPPSQFTATHPSFKKKQNKNSISVMVKAERALWPSPAVRQAVSECRPASDTVRRPNESGHTEEKPGRRSEGGEERRGLTGRNFLTSRTL